MSELAKTSRDAMKAKAHRMTTADPHQKVDASSWTPPEALDTAKKLNQTPRVGRKHGGKVEGDAALQHAGKAPRVGNKRVHRDIGGPVSGGPMPPQTIPTTRFNFGPTTNSSVTRTLGLKTGGAATDEKVKGREKRMIGGSLALLSPALMAANALRGKKDDDSDSAPGKKRGGKVHEDQAQDEALIRKDVKASALKKAGGSVSDGELEGTRPTGGRLARKSGGRAKGKTDINIIINSGEKPHPATGGPPPMAMLPPHPPMPMPAGPPPMPAGPPPGMAPPGMGGPPPGPPMPMPRKRGGRTGYPIDAGAGSGLGRLEKVGKA